jgi:hypothetical protein
LPLAKSRDKEKKGNKLPFGGRKAGNVFVPEGEFFSFLFPQRGKLLFFSSFVFARGKRNRGKRTKGRNSPKGTFSFSFGFVLLLFAYFFVLLWFRLPLAKSRDKEKKGNKRKVGIKKRRETKRRKK